MSTSNAVAVRATAVASCLLSAVTLVLSGRTGDPLPVKTINLSVLSAGAAGMALLLHARTPENNVWRVLLVIAVAGPLAVAAYAIADLSRPLQICWWARCGWWTRCWSCPGSCSSDCSPTAIDPSAAGRSWSGAAQCSGHRLAHRVADDADRRSLPHAGTHAR